MKILFQFIHYDNEDCQYHTKEQVSTFSKDVMHRVRLKVRSYLEDNPSDIVLITGFFFPRMITYKAFCVPFTRDITYKKVSCDLL